MSAWSLLFGQYTFSQFADLIYKSIGAGNLILILLALIGLLSYLSAIGTSGGAFGHLNDTKLIGLNFLSGLAIYGSIPIILIMLIEQPLNTFITFLPLYLFPQILTETAKFFIPENWTYDNFAYKNKQAQRILYRVLERIAGEEKPKKKREKGEVLLRVIYVPEIMIILITLEAVFFLSNLIHTSLVGWFIIIYEILLTLVSAALFSGVMRRYIKGSYVKITKTNGQDEEGYLMSMAKDHFILVTKERAKVIYTQNLKELFDEKPPDETREDE